MGPLELTDLVGLDVRLSIADHLVGQLGSRFKAPALLRDKVAAGELGRKSGKGFYDWSSGRAQPSDELPRKRQLSRDRLSSEPAQEQL
jgi:3-hydroxyacyl-CoA dehydrogenase